MRCPLCQEEHPDDAERCPESWKVIPRRPQPRSLPAPQPDEPPPPHDRPGVALEPVPPEEARLALQVGEHLVVRMAVGETVVLGRVPHSPIAGACGGNDNVSRAHAELTAPGPGPDDLVLVDVGSTNGTYVNGEPLQPNVPRRLQPGDVVELANRPPLVLHVVTHPSRT